MIFTERRGLDIVKELRGVKVCGGDLGLAMRGGDLGLSESGGLIESWQFYLTTEVPPHELRQIN